MEYPSLASLMAPEYVSPYDSYHLRYMVNTLAKHPRYVEDFITLIGEQKFMPLSKYLELYFLPSAALKACYLAAFIFSSEKGRIVFPHKSRRLSFHSYVYAFFAKLAAAGDAPFNTVFVD